MSLLERLSKVGIKGTTLSESEVYSERKLTDIQIPVANIAFSGEVDQGFGSGVTVLAGPSKHFKSNTGILMLAAYLKQHQDAVVLFYDSEFGAPPDYWANFGIDVNRVLHVPIENIEHLKFDLPQKLEDIKRGEKVIIFVDSIGNLASKKEVEDALESKGTVDMTRARQIKSLFRIVTPMIKMRDLPAIFIAHTYQTQEMYSKAVVSGGCLVEGTKIIMDDGSLKEIQNVLVGDKVKTLTGSNEVTNTWNPDTLTEGTPECYEIEFEDGHTVICSDLHRFLVDGKWVEAFNLEEGMEVSAV